MGLVDAIREKVGISSGWGGGADVDPDRPMSWAALPLGGEDRSDGGRYRGCLGAGARGSIGGNWKRQSSPKPPLEYISRFVEHPVRSWHSDGQRPPIWSEATAVVDVAAVGSFELVAIVAVRNQTQAIGEARENWDIWKQSLHRLLMPPSMSNPSPTAMATPISKTNMRHQNQREPATDQWHMSKRLFWRERGRR